MRDLSRALVFIACLAWAMVSLIGNSGWVTVLLFVLAFVGPSIIIGKRGSP